MIDQVFCLRAPGSQDDEWRIAVAGKVHPALFNSRGAAIAGLAVEQRRAQRARNAAETGRAAKVKR